MAGMRARRSVGLGRRCAECQEEAEPLVSSSIGAAKSRHLCEGCLLVYRQAQEQVRLNRKAQREELDRLMREERKRTAVYNPKAQPGVLRASSIALQNRIAQRDGGYCCRYCGDTSFPLTLDHVLPKSRGGTNAESNLVLACAACNSEKGARLPHECGMEFLTPSAPLRLQCPRCFGKTAPGEPLQAEGICARCIASRAELAALG